MLNLNNETYDHIKEEMIPIVHRYLKSLGREFSDIKLLDRDTLYLSILAIDKKGHLDRLIYTFLADGTWENYVIQSSARRKECTELFANYRADSKAMGWTDEQLYESSFSFFERSPTFEDKEKALKDQQLTEDLKAMEKPSSSNN